MAGSSKSPEIEIFNFILGLEAVTPLFASTSHAPRLYSHLRYLFATDKKTPRVSHNSICLLTEYHENHRFSRSISVFPIGGGAHSEFRIVE